MFAGISLSALAGAALSRLKELGNRILFVLCFVAVLVLVLLALIWYELKSRLNRRLKSRLNRRKE